MLAAGRVLVNEVEIEVERAAYHRRSQLDQGDALVVRDGPGRACTTLTGKLAHLELVEHGGALIGLADAERAGHAAANRAALAVGKAHTDHRAGLTVGDELRAGRHDLDAPRCGHELHFALQLGRHRAVGIDDCRRKDILCAREWNATPHRDAPGVVRRATRSLEGQRIDRFAVDLERDLLAGLVADDSSNRWNAWIVIDCRK